MTNSASGARRYRLSGRVQGVGFRYFTQRLATEIGVTGWVKNLEDGTVESQVAGSQEQIDLFKAGLTEGPAESRVDQIDERELNHIPSWSRFDIAF